VIHLRRRDFVELWTNGRHQSQPSFIENPGPDESWRIGRRGRGRILV
jgi:hypothetical protein